MTLNFALVPAGSATLSGRVLDEQGNGVPNQYLELFPAGGGSGAYITTDSAGHYSFQVAPGSYTIQFAPNGPASNAPRDYYLYSSSFSVTQDTTLVLPLPAKKVTVHVQDATGDPVANVVVSTNQPNNCPAASSEPRTRPRYTPRAGRPRTRGRSPPARCRPA